MRPALRQGVGVEPVSGQRVQRPRHRLDRPLAGGSSVGKQALHHLGQRRLQHRRVIIGQAVFTRRQRGKALHLPGERAQVAGAGGQRLKAGHPQIGQRATGHRRGIGGGMADQFQRQPIPGRQHLRRGILRSQRPTAGQCQNQRQRRDQVFQHHPLRDRRRSACRARLNGHVARGVKLGARGMVSAPPRSPPPPSPAEVPGGPWPRSAAAALFSGPARLRRRTSPRSHGRQSV